jgi:hypothetical protein
LRERWISATDTVEFVGAEFGISFGLFRIRHDRYTSRIGTRYLPSHPWTIGPSSRSRHEKKISTRAMQVLRFGFDAGSSAGPVAAALRARAMTAFGDAVSALRQAAVPALVDFMVAAGDLIEIFRRDVVVLRFGICHETVSSGCAGSVGCVALQRRTRTF